ncbi:MAG: hypothetical protein KME32_24995 [Mojavia pulchra JT2-VF2]|jgi:hypothetical protein|uniref:Uncharacterized protein n=1 Tax=Mojavia pulchra JT2-VF2 TaxID=287848 RepID=A0A951Q1S1_9NOST|nr:hypothetical protein [Mojavia pulchra JT2-VF2]
MKAKEQQQTKTENIISLTENTGGYKNHKKTRKVEPISQVQRDNVITDKDELPSIFRNAFILVILAILLVAAIYYRIINP